MTVENVRPIPPVNSPHQSQEDWRASGHLKVLGSIRSCLITGAVNRVNPSEAKQLSSARSRHLTNVVLIIFLSVYIATLCQSAMGISPLQVKQFITTPPDTGTIHSTVATASQLTKGSSSIQERIYTFRWAGTNFIIFEHTTNSPKSTSDVVRATGSYQGKNWEYSQQRLIFFGSDVPQDASLGSLFLLRTLQHFGIQNVGSSEIEWDSDTFTGKLENGLTIRGKLKSKDNLVTGIDYSVQKANFAYEIDFGYDSVGKRELQFPATLLTFGLEEGHRVPLLYFKIDHLDMSVLDSADLNPEVIFASAGSVVTLSGTGVAFVKPQQPATDAGLASVRIRRVILVVLMLTTCGFAIFLFAARHGLIQKNRTE